MIHCQQGVTHRRREKYPPRSGTANTTLPIGKALRHELQIPQDRTRNQFSAVAAHIKPGAGSRHIALRRWARHTRMDQTGTTLLWRYSDYLLLPIRRIIRFPLFQFAAVPDWRPGESAGIAEDHARKGRNRIRRREPRRCPVRALDRRTRLGGVRLAAAMGFTMSFRLFRYGLPEMPQARKGLRYRAASDPRRDCNPARAMRRLRRSGNWG